MAKKLFIILMLFVQMTTTHVFADGDNPTPLPIKPINPESQHDGPAKAPIQIPEVYLDDHTLSFDAAIEGCEVRLLDEDENVIFSDFIAISQTSLILPATLSGTYELQIIRGNFIFYCEIEL